MEFDVSSVECRVDIGTSRALAVFVTLLDGIVMGNNGSRESLLRNSRA